MKRSERNSGHEELKRAQQCRFFFFFAFFLKHGICAAFTSAYLITVKVTELILQIRHTNKILSLSFVHTNFFFLIQWIGNDVSRQETEADEDDGPRPYRPHAQMLFDFSQDRRCSHTSLKQNSANCRCR